MVNLPSGTVTFLFTDIEGSTIIAQQYPYQWETMRARHHSLLTSAIESNRGHVFQIVGDAFCAAFHSAPDALQAALQAQRDLLREVWNPAPVKVRMGIHTGLAQPGDMHDRFGGYTGYATLVLVQRVMSVGHGGQILLSKTSAELVRSDLPDQVSLQDMGDHRLKGLLNLERLWQVNAPDLPQEFPALESIKTITSNLPLQLTSFVGREREIREVKQELGKHRLVTLTGIGGTGKTRLSLQVAAGLTDFYPDGVWFVEFAPLSEPSLVIKTVAEVLKVVDVPNQPILDTLKDFLKNRHTLLVLDNCEHLVQACSGLARELLRACPQVGILASSREGLAVAGEQIYAVSPLPLPELGEKRDLISISQSASVQLFVDRAESVKSNFRLTEENAGAVAFICRRLDGIPLALELAAARLQMMTAQKLAEMLEDRFRLLTGGKWTVLPHQQTLRALIDWSYDLLSEPERAVLRRLSVFTGGWTLEAAEMVCAGENVDELEVLDLLSNLVEKSLVTCDCNSEIPRYFMLSTLRQYAGEKLDTSEETERYRQTHAAYFQALAEEAEPQLTGTDQADWFDLLDTEHDNLRAAIEWALVGGRAEIAQRLCGSLGRFWWVHGHMTEGRRWLEQALATRAGVSKAAQAKALRWAGGLAWPQGDLQAAKTAFDESISLYRELGDIEGMASVLGNLGTVAQNQGDYTGAWAMFSQSLEYLRELGNKWGMANALNNLGNVAQERGDFVEAQKLHEESLAYRRQLGDTRGMGIALINLGSISLELHKLEPARAYFEQSLKINYEISARMMLAYNLSGIAQVACEEGQTCGAAKLQGAANKLLEEMGAALEPYEQSLYEKTSLVLKLALGEDSYQQEFDAGRVQTIEQAIDLALRKAG